MMFFFFFQAEDGIRDGTVTGVQTCALPIWSWSTDTWTCTATAPTPRRPIRTGSRARSASSPTSTASAARAALPHPGTRSSALPGLRTRTDPSGPRNPSRRPGNPGSPSRGQPPRSPRPARTRGPPGPPDPPSSSPCSEPSQRSTHRGSAPRSGTPGSGTPGSGTLGNAAPRPSAAPSRRHGPTAAHGTGTSARSNTVEPPPVLDVSQGLSHRLRVTSVPGGIGVRPGAPSHSSHPTRRQGFLDREGYLVGGLRFNPLRDVRRLSCGRDAWLLGCWFALWGVRGLPWRVLAGWPAYRPARSGDENPGGPGRV